MKYYSELLKKIYDKQEDLLSAEKKYTDAKEKKEREQKELANARKARAHEVEEARKEMNSAIKKYNDLLNAFVRDYKYYHYSTTGDDPTLIDFLNMFI